MKDCLFCKIVSGSEPSWKVYEDERVYAYLDIFPVNVGHTQVIPKKHSVNLHDIPNEDLVAVTLAVKKIAKAIKKGLNADGINIMQNNGEAAGQVINHSHTHVIPRFKNDGLKLWPPKTFEESKRDEVLQKIKKAL